MITSTDIEYWVRQATDASEGTYDVPGIVAEIIDRFGRVDLDTLDHDTFWSIVIDHATD